MAKPPNTAPETTPDPVQSAQDDVAFIRDLIQRGGKGSISGGAVFLAGGGLYGLQCLYQLAELKGWVHLPHPFGLLLLVFITAAFLAVLGWVIWKEQKKPRPGLMNRAQDAVFGGIGLANLAMVIVFGFNAATAGDIRVWLFYPAVIFALQGAAWYASAVLRKRLWQGVVAGGWLLTAVVLGLTREHLEIYLLVTTAALFLLMALPGYVLIRLARESD